MPEIRTVTTLVKKRDEIRASIRMYEKKIAQARSDLAHVSAVMRLAVTRHGVIGAREKCNEEQQFTLPAITVGSAEKDTVV